MIKHLTFIGTLLLFLLPLVGCGKSSESPQDTVSLNQNRGRQGEALFASSTSRVVVKKEDLKIGEKIMAMGAENSDGSITASQIILGGLENRFGFRTGIPTSTNSPEQPGRPLGRQNGGGANRGNMGALARLSGEILKLEENNLVLKIDDGGSKIIYFTDKTEIFKINPPEPGAVTTTGKAN